MHARLFNAQHSQIKVTSDQETQTCREWKHQTQLDYNSHVNQKEQRAPEASLGWSFPR